MDDNLYIIIVIALTIFIIFYGGHNYQNKIEYNSKFFDNFNAIIVYENKLQKSIHEIQFIDIDHVNINNRLKICKNLIPNFIDCFYIKINPYQLFNINKIVKKENHDTHIMIIFNHNSHNNLELLINNSNFYEKNMITSQYYNGYFYDLEKKISILGIFHIYNNSKEIIYITCFILIKPFWHY